MTVSGEKYSANKTADQSVTNSTALVIVSDLSIIVPRDALIAYKFFIPFNLAGVVSGYKFQVDLTAVVSNYLNHLLIFQGGAAVLVNSQMQVASAAVAGALAVAGNHILICSGMIDNRAAAADNLLRIKFAQNAADAAAITILKGSFVTYHTI